MILTDSFVPFSFNSECFKEPEYDLDWLLSTIPKIAKIFKLSYIEASKSVYRIFAIDLLLGNTVRNRKSGLFYRNKSGNVVTTFLNSKEKLLSRRLEYENILKDNTLFLLLRTEGEGSILFKEEKVGFLQSLEMIDDINFIAEIESIFISVKNKKDEINEVIDSLVDFDKDLKYYSKFLKAYLEFKINHILDTIADIKRGKEDVDLGLIYE